MLSSPSWIRGGWGASITTGGEQTRGHQLQQENNGCGEHQRQEEEENGHGDINAPRPPLILEGELGNTRLPLLDKRGLGGVECNRTTGGAGGFNNTDGSRNSTLGREQTRGDINAPWPPLILEGELRGMMPYFLLLLLNTHASLLKSQV